MIKVFIAFLDQFFSSIFYFISFKNCTWQKLLGKLKFHKGQSRENQSPINSALNSIDFVGRHVSINQLNARDA